ncbi:MAG: hypothetical protein GY823_09625 [Flavobacteriaceae bacterium]|nr:hypothetical protein [Flavobacteriaceae bacterium]
MDVEKRLVTVNDQFSELIVLSENAQKDKAAIKSLYGALKTKLRAGRDKYQLEKTEKVASEAELCFYYPAVSETVNSLTVAIGGKVDDHFISTLYDAQGQIECYLNQIRSI